MTRCCPEYADKSVSSLDMESAVLLPEPPDLTILEIYVN